MIYLSPHGDYAEIGYVVALGEVCRRTMWSIFRVESEHVGNADGCARAHSQAPLTMMQLPRHARRAATVRQAAGAA